MEQEISMSKRYPSVKTLTAAFGKEKAVKIRAIMEGPYAVDGVSRMERIDEVLGTFGVECIPEGNNSKSPQIVYCNTGDTYGTTVMRVGGVFRVGCWGDIVEKGNYD